MEEIQKRSDALIRSIIVEGSIQSEIEKLEFKVNKSDNAEEFLLYHQKKNSGIEGPALILSLEYSINPEDAENFILTSVVKAGYSSLEELLLTSGKSLMDEKQAPDDEKPKFDPLNFLKKKRNSSKIEELISTNKYPKKMNWWITYAVLLTYVAKIAVSLILISNDVSVVANSNIVGPMLIRGAIAGGIINNAISKGKGLQYAKFENVMILVTVIFIIQLVLGSVLELTI
jgi:hypothetical protein